MTIPKPNPQTNSASDNAAILANDRLNKFIVTSLAFHCILFVLFAVRAFFVPPEPIPLEHAIRVDIVALPDKPAAKPPRGIKEPESKPKPEAPPESKPEALKPIAETNPQPKVPPKTEPTKINLNKTKKEQEAALKRLNAIEKLKHMQETESQPSRAQQASAPVKGNEISAGSSLTGLSKIEHENYAETVHDQIKRHWNLPQWMANVSLSATVRIFIDSRGGLVKKELIRSSNNPVFDQSVLTAVDASLPLPRPPNNLMNLIAVRGIDIEFIPSEN